MWSNARAWSVVLAAAVVACGGGGGGAADGSPRVRWSPDPVAAAFAQGQNGVVLTVTGAVSGLSASPHAATLTDDSGNILEDPIQIEATSASTFEATFHPRCGLTPGIHGGNITLQLCKDAACAEPYTLAGASLPYTFTVGDPDLSITIEIDGEAQAVALACNNPTVDITSGHSFTLRASKAVTWDGSIAVGSTDAWLTDQEWTDTTFSATVHGSAYGGAPLPVGVTAGYLMENATAGPHGVHLSLRILGGG